MRCTSGRVFLTSLLILLRTRRTNAAADVSPEFQNKVPARLVWAMEGEDVELPCDITPPTPNDSVNMVLWFKDAAGIPLYSLDARNGELGTAIHWAVSDDLGRRSYFQIGDGHRAKLKVTKVTLKDQGIFRCRVDFIDSPTRNFRVNLTLVEEPTSPVIYDAQGREVTGVAGPFLEGYNLALTCQVSGGRPRPSVTWWKDGELLDGVVDTASVGSPSKFTVNHLFIDKVTRALWGTKLECRAQSGPMGKPIVREVPLDVYLKPAAVKIVLNEDYQIYAGRPIAARCESWGSSPAARIVWRLGGQAIGKPNVSSTQRSNSTVSKLALALAREDDGKELTCRAENPRFPGGVLEQTKLLRVAYAPSASIHLATGYVLDNLREGDDLKLVCTVQSNPPASKVIWYHDNDRLEHDVAGGVLLASNTLTLRVLTLGLSGEYSCEAINSVGGGRSSPIFIHMKYAPRCRPGEQRREVPAGRHETVALRCEVEAIPEDLLRFSWTFNGTRGDVLPLPGSRPRNKGLVSVLEYTPSTDADFGTLACWASNAVGRQRTPCLFEIVPAKPPQSPLDCSLANGTRALEVNCIPGSDGGSPQHFLLQVRRNFDPVNPSPGTVNAPQSDQGTAGEPATVLVDQQTSQRPNFHLPSLDPALDYTLLVYAVNGRGKSEPALIEHVRVPERIRGGLIEQTTVFLEDLKKALPRPSSENMIIVIALTGTGAVALILVGIGVIIGLAICRRRTSLPARQPLEDFTSPTYVPAQRIEPRIRYSNDSRRSQRASLYVEDNRNEPDLLQRVEIDLQD